MHWTATITFKYSDAPIKEKDRAVNPLGFQVVAYRDDPDAMPVSTDSPDRFPPVSRAPDSVMVFPEQVAPSPATAVPAIQP